MTSLSRLWALLLIACIALPQVACRSGGAPAPDVVARVGDRELPYAEFESYLRQNSLATEVALSSEILSGLFDQFLDEVLLARLASDRGFGDVIAASEAIEAMVEASLPREFSEAEVSRYYLRNQAEFSAEETVILRQILVERRGEAERALSEIAAGRSFDETAREHSQGPGAALGGLQGELARADLPPAFADVIFGLEVGEVSGIVQADYGFHVFQVVERRGAAVPVLDDLRLKISARLRSEARAQISEQLVGEARSGYNVVVYARNLPFNYAGVYE